MRHTGEANSAIYRPTLHWAAIALVVSVFPLIWMGGLVTTKGAGLSVPDWPNSYGYNMFLFPPSQWLGGIFYEHTHRLLGTLSGFLSIALMLFAWAPGRTPAGRRAWFRSSIVSLFLAILILFIPTYPEGTPGFSWNRYGPHFIVGFLSLSLVAALGVFCRHREPRAWIRWLTVGVFVAVCIQGTLGGLRVEKVNLTLAMIHGCFAEAFLCLAAFAALTTSRWWLRAANRSREANAERGQTAMRLAAMCVAVIFCQLIVGAVMRHSGAGLAIPDLPLAYGHILPPMDETQLLAANQTRAWTYKLPGVSLAQIWLHFAHRMGALIVTSAVGFFVFFVFRKLRSDSTADRAIRRLAGILGALVIVQFSLGVLTVYLKKPADLTTLHVATGALTLMTASLALGISARLYGSRVTTAERLSGALHLVSA